MLIDLALQPPVGGMLANGSPREVSKTLVISRRMSRLLRGTMSMRSRFRGCIYPRTHVLVLTAIYVYVGHTIIYLASNPDTSNLLIDVLTSTVGPPPTRLFQRLDAQSVCHGPDVADGDGHVDARAGHYDCMSVCRMSVCMCVCIVGRQPIRINLTRRVEVA